MKFSVFQPPQAKSGRVPVLYYLAGLTCTEETFAIKAGAQRTGGRTGPDAGGTRYESSRCQCTGRDGLVGLRRRGRVLCRCHSRAVVQALPDVQLCHPRTAGADRGEISCRCRQRQGVFGHSMGGHGALVCALRNPGLYKSLSAFAPIAAPMHCPWGKKAFRGYLGDDHAAWQEYDASELVKRVRFAGTILVDQGLADKFLSDQLHPEVLRGRLPQCRPVADVAPPGRLRSRLLFHLDVHGRPPAPSCLATKLITQFSPQRRRGRRGNAMRQYAELKIDGMTIVDSMVAVSSRKQSKWNCCLTHFLCAPLCLKGYSGLRQGICGECVR